MGIAFLSTVTDSTQVSATGEYMQWDGRVTVRWVNTYKDYWMYLGPGGLIPPRHTLPLTTDVLGTGRGLNSVSPLSPTLLVSAPPGREVEKQKLFIQGDGRIFGLLSYTVID